MKKSVQLVGFSHYKYTPYTKHYKTKCYTELTELCIALRHVQSTGPPWVRNWTSHTHINNKQQSDQFQCTIPTARAGESQCPKCRYGNIKTVLP